MKYRKLKNVVNIGSIGYIGVMLKRWKIEILGINEIMDKRN